MEGQRQEMNNIPQKNVILQTHESKVLPYGGNDVRFSNELPMDSVEFNSSYRQFVENDLFIGKQLNRLSGSQYGPKPYEMLAGSQLDGGKFWYGTESGEQPEIIHKTNSPLSATLEPVANVSSNVNYLAQFSMW